MSAAAIVAASGLEIRLNRMDAIERHFMHRKTTFQGIA